MAQQPTLQDAMTVINRLSPDDQRSLLRSLQERLSAGEGDNENWALEGEQLAFMLQHHDEIEAAYANQDMAVLSTLEASEVYKKLFGAMSWDEACDRYEET